MRIMEASLATLWLLAGGAGAAEITVSVRQVEDRKAVLATVEPVRQLIARTRLGGTIVSLKVREGDTVAPGARTAPSDIC